MAKFPTKENDVLALAAHMVAGLAANPSIFNNPPITVAVLNNYLSVVNMRIISIDAIRGSLTAEFQLKDIELNTNLVPAMKQILAWAEAITNNDPAKLQLIGWDGRKEPAPSTPPGQPRYFEAVHQGQGTVDFDWKAAASGDGGLLKSYCIECRELPSGPWKECGSTAEREKTVENLPRGIELEFRVCGMNAAGIGAPSNTVSLVL
jgi:hypothetical protein